MVQQDARGSALSLPLGGTAAFRGWQVVDPDFHDEQRLVLERLEDQRVTADVVIGLSSAGTIKTGVAGASPAMA